MAALTKNRNTPERGGSRRGFGVAATKECFAGGIAVVNSSGYAQPGTTATGLKCVGRFAEYMDNSAGADGDLTVEVENGIFRYANSAAADEIALADVGGIAYIVDDQTVAKTNAGGTRSPAGIIDDVDDAGVWVRMGQDALVATAGALLAANNLSDLASAATARSNLGGGANKVVLEIRDVDLVGANAQVKRVVSPVAGTIAQLYSVIDGALTTGDATLTGKIGATAITDGAITITQAGSAAGDVDSATPSAANTVAVGDVISVTVGGTNDAARLGDVVIVITPSA